MAMLNNQRVYCWDPKPTNLSTHDSFVRHQVCTNWVSAARDTQKHQKNKQLEVGLLNRS